MKGKDTDGQLGRHIDRMHQVAKILLPLITIGSRNMLLS